MTRPWGRFAGVAAILMTASGCMMCGYSGYHHARQAGPECELPVCQRNGVYVFAMGSLNPISVVALDGLRAHLNRQGYAKVATGQTIHAGWMNREMRRIRDAEPEAHFIVIRFESAGPVAVRLAERRRRRARRRRGGRHRLGEARAPIGSGPCSRSAAGRRGAEGSRPRRRRTCHTRTGGRWRTIEAGRVS